MKSPIYAAVLLSAVSGAFAYPAATSGWMSYLHDGQSDVLTMFCQPNATVPGKIDMFWGTQGFQDVTQVTFVSAQTETTLPLTKTGGGFGNVDITDISGVSAIAATGVVDPSNKQTVVSVCVFNEPAIYH